MDDTLWLARAKTIEVRQKAAEARWARPVRRPWVRSLVDRVRQTD
jgi:hypothetical protein